MPLLTLPPELLVRPRRKIFRFQRKVFFEMPLTRDFAVGVLNTMFWKGERKITQVRSERIFRHELRLL